ncbi:hypothetical protein B0T21DRAFT_385596 [Apiosordaria backusii]|uniref:Uncharacterized protein n=1 Tax=Apiosordaria backusii TaxID=314023 RepID=A0AA40B263_9PEZI|nr:hypothetical protein B0T21DRAFT_385596 [Apiosordaria backusii]
MANPQHQYGQMPAQYSVLPEVADYSNQAPEVVAHDQTQKQATTTAGTHYYPPSQDTSTGAGASAYSPPAYVQEPKSNYDGAATTVAAIQSSHPESSSTPSAGPNRKVTILSVLVGILAVAVVALAAATGLMAKRAGDKDVQIASMNAQLQSAGVDSSPSSEGSGGAAAAEKETATVTVIAPAATGTGSSGSGSPPSTSAFLVGDVSNGCNAKGEKITGTDYTTKLYGKVTFRRYCNQKTISDPIYAMHTPDFETCLEACASWSQALPYVFADVSDKNRVNVTCSAVNFVPKWTDKNESARKQARGNCYLKSGEQTEEKSLRASGSDPVGHTAIVIKQAAKKD